MRAASPPDALWDAARDTAPESIAAEACARLRAELHDMQAQALEAHNRAVEALHHSETMRREAEARLQTSNTSYSGFDAVTG